MDYRARAFVFFAFLPFTGLKAYGYAWFLRFFFSVFTAKIVRFLLPLLFTNSETPFLCQRAVFLNRLKLL